MKQLIKSIIPIPILKIYYKVKFFFRPAKWDLRPGFELLLDKKDLVGAEIGVFSGDHAKTLIRALKPKRLFLIDEYKQYMDWSQKDLDLVKWQAFKKLNKYDCVKWILKESSLAANEIQDNSLDFVYLDADHSYEGVKNDLENYVGKVKIGGLVAGDDYREDHEEWGVVPAVNEYVDKFGYDLRVKDMIWYFTK